MDYGLQALKLVLGLLILTLTLRLLGKQNMAQMTPYDLVYIIVFGGILDSIFYDDKIGIFPFIFSALVWSISIYVIETLVKKFHIFRVFFRGTPDHIVETGKINLKLFDKNNLEFEQLRIVLREKGIFSLREVKDIYLEPDGQFSIIKYSNHKLEPTSSINLEKAEVTPNFLLIDEGEIELSVLKYIGKSEEWLKNEMNILGINDITTVVYCEWSDTNGFYYKTYNDCINQKKKGNIN
ncbi:DUF421 domain-containing protein [Acetoanaerobium noterae]|uniref:DUF421 domain-containing protein n=1 Tax=Acetoanaerobium noterae TaxID=745369 RepID=UPI003340ECA9